MLLLMALFCGYRAAITCCVTEKNTPAVVSIIIFSIIAITYFGFQRLFKKKISSIALIVISAVLGIGVSMLKNLMI
jgi:hypothetical protein